MRQLAQWAALPAALAALALGLVACARNEMLAPLTRAFGVPPESELARCRVAFRQLQAHFETSNVQVTAVMFATGGDGLWRGGPRYWREDLARNLAAQAQTRTKARLVVSPDPIPVPFPDHMYHNQLKYLWERAAVYSDWIKLRRPRADYILVAEVFGGPGKKEGAVQLYVFDAQGQVALCRLARFEDHRPDEESLSIQLIVGALFETLKMDADQIYPPYGWG